MADISKVLLRGNKANQTIISDVYTPTEPKWLQFNKWASDGRQSNVSYMKTWAQIKFLKIDQDCRKSQH